MTQLTPPAARQCASRILDRCEFGPARSLVMARAIIEAEVAATLAPLLAAIEDGELRLCDLVSRLVQASRDQRALLNQLDERPPQRKGLHS